MKVYLDTNILIRGSNDPEHEELKRLCKENRIALYKSFHADIEQHGKTGPARKKSDSAAQSLYLSPEAFESFRSAKKAYLETRESEENEKKYWKDVPIHHASSSFHTLVFLNQLRFIPDVKGEMILFEELLNERGLKTKDAFHIISAQSSGMDYLLTWDRKSFINKCKNIKWLRPKVMTPKEFLQGTEF
jgi:predicted nucleic acid-binding protein